MQPKPFVIPDATRLQRALHAFSRLPGCRHVGLWLLSRTLTPEQMRNIMDIP